MSAGVLLFQIPENFLESKPFKRRAKSALCMLNFRRLPNLHTTPIVHLIKFRTLPSEKRFLLRKLYTTFTRAYLNSIKFLEILNSNTKPNIFSTYQLKIAFQRSNFLRKPFFMCSKMRTHPPRVLKI